MIEMLGYIFVGLSVLAPWALLITAYFGRQWLTEHIKRGVQHQFDERIEELRSELRKNEEQFKADLAGKESEIAALRSALLSGSASRQALADKRRFDAVERIWAALNDLYVLKSLAQSMALMKFDEFAKRVDDPKIQMFLEVIGGTVPDESQLKNVARDEQPFVPELAWAYYSAYRTVLYSALARYKVLRIGEKDPGKYITTEPLKKILKAALPHHSKWIDENEAGAYYYLLDELEGLLVAELRKIVDGRDADRDAAERAKDIMAAVSNAEKEKGRSAAQAAGLKPTTDQGALI